MALLLRLVKNLVEKEIVIEETKSVNMMLWGQKMSSIHNRATEIVNDRLIFTV